MSANRKLQTEIDRTLKKVEEGVEIFDEIWEKVYSATQQNQKEKYEVDLKKEIKKLQRHRDQVKTWVASSDIKDKRPLLDARKLIETKMEQFKVCEKETKTKTYSKEGLAREAKLDPSEIAKNQTRDWLNEKVDALMLQIDMHEADMEKLTSGKGSKRNKNEIEALEASIKRHRWHIAKLEQITRLLDNDALGHEEINEIKEDVEYYIDANQEPDFMDAYDETMDIFESLDLGELPLEDDVALIGIGSSKSVQDTKDDTDEKPTKGKKKKSKSGDDDDDTSTDKNNDSDKKKKKDSKKSDKDSKKKDKKSSTTATVPLTIGRATKGAPAPAPSSTTNIASPKLVPAPKPAGLPAGIPAPVVVPPPQPPGQESMANILLKQTAKDTNQTPMAARLREINAAQQQTVSGQRDRPGGPSTTVGPPSLNSQQPGAVGQALGSGLGSRLEQSPLSIQSQPLPTNVSGSGYPPFTSSQPQPTTSSSLSSPRLTSTQSPGQRQPTGAQQSIVAPPPIPALTGINAQSKLNTSPMANTAKQLQQRSSQQQRSSPVQRNAFRGQLLPPGASLEPLLDINDCAAVDDTYARLRDNYNDQFWTLTNDKENDSSKISHISALADLDASTRTAPRKADSERPKQYVPRNPYNTPAAFPSSPAAAFDDPRVFEKLGTDTLFFIFYFCQGTYQQYLAAKQLKKQSWRYHNKYMTWFQRHEEPKVSTDEYEQGAYVYFDYETGWCQRIKSDFTFEYNFLEDELVA